MKKKALIEKKKKAKQFFQINTKKNLTNDNQIQFIGNWPTVWHDADLEMCQIFISTVLSSLFWIKWKVYWNRLGANA